MSTSSTAGARVVNARAARFAWSVLALTIFLIAVDLAIFLYDVAVSGHQPDPNYLALRVQIPIFGIGFTAVGAVVASRLPRNRSAGSSLWAARRQACNP